MVASGNDFVIVDNRGNKIKNPTALAKKICDRKYGIGADGLLLLEKSGLADIKMRIFNADGSEAEMCGNGARCVAFWLSKNLKPRTQNPRIETKVGIIESYINNGDVKIKLTNPRDLKLDIPLQVNKRNIKINFIDTGVPHAVIFVEGLKDIDVDEIGQAIRYHHKFSPRGTNVDFVEVLKDNLIAIRTYERGVEDETLACGTGSVAAALIFALKTRAVSKVQVQTKSNELLRVFFKKLGRSFREVWLEGKVRIVHKGEYYV